MLQSMNLVRSYEPRKRPVPQAVEGNAYLLSLPASPASVNSYAFGHKHRPVCPNASFKNTEI